MTLQISSRVIISIFVLIISASSARALEPQFAQNTQRIVDLFTSAEGEQRFSGVVFVKTGAQTLFESSFGFADPATGLANSPDTAFRIGGITRTFTAAAILKLAGENKIAVNDPIQKYLPELAGKKNGRITLHQLLSESSGIPDYIPTWRTAWKMSFGGKKEPPAGGSAGIVKRITSQNSLFEAGSRSEFSHSNSMILGQVVERVEKRPFTAWMRSWLDSLSLLRTGFDIAADNPPSGRASGFALFPNIDPRSWKKPPQRMLIEDTHPEWNLSAASMYSTTRDLALWIDAIASNQALAAPEREQLFARHIAKTENRWAGFGWDVYNVGNMDVMTQVGAAPGFYSIIMYVPSRELTVIVLSNLEDTAYNRKNILQELLKATTL